MLCHGHPGTLIEAWPRLRDPQEKEVALEMALSATGIVRRLSAAFMYLSQLFTADGPNFQHCWEVLRALPSLHSRPHWALISKSLLCLHKNPPQEGHYNKVFIPKIWLCLYLVNAKAAISFLSCLLFIHELSQFYVLFIRILMIITNIYWAMIMPDSVLSTLLL